MNDREQRIPGNILYGYPDACRAVLACPDRSAHDKRWRWPDIPAPLPPSETRLISWSLLRRWIGGEAAVVMLDEAREAGR